MEVAFQPTRSYDVASVPVDELVYIHMTYEKIRLLERLVQFYF